MNLIEKIHWFDALVVGILAAGAAIGASRGVLRQTVRLITHALAIFVALSLHEKVVAFLEASGGELGSIPHTHSFLGTYLVVYVVLFIVAHLFQKAIKALCLSPEERKGRTTLQALGLESVDRLLGAALGTIVAALVVGMGLLALTLNPDEQVETALEKSHLRPVMLRGIQRALVALPQEYKEKLDAALEHLEKAGRGVADDLLRKGIDDRSDKTDSAASGVDRARKAAATLSNGHTPMPGATTNRQGMPDAPLPR